MVITAEGIVLRQRKIANNRRMIVLFTKQYGKISAGTSVNEKSRSKAIAKLAKQMVTKNSSFITLIYGEDVTDEEAEETRKYIETKIAKNFEVTLVNGGQPVYYYILSVE